MATALKHKQRSHRSYQQSRSATFAKFERKANVRSAQRSVKKENILDKVKKMFRRDQSK